jgi:hypothetical protein
MRAEFQCFFIYPSYLKEMQNYEINRNLWKKYLRKGFSKTKLDKKDFKFMMAQVPEYIEK